eukprot:gene20130-22102_t
MYDSWRLLTLSVAMFLGSFLAGIVPLAMSLSEKSLRVTSIIGAGLLVGTALAVIIPEGVHELYENYQHEVGHEMHRHAHVRDTAALTAPSFTDQLSTENTIHHHEHSGMELHTLIGISLSLGFVFMLFVDQLSGGHSHSSPDSNTEKRSKLTATIGLVVHAAADGIALGAAATTSRADVEMIVFIAIMLHKAPAAFGLTSFLMSENYARNRIRKHLLIFSIAAPLSAIITYYGLSQGSKEVLSNINATGITMLFSAGTFLYVATVHILPDLKESIRNTSLEEGKVSSSDQGSSHFTSSDLCYLVLDCNVIDNQRIDCGWHGIDQAICETSVNCCWKSAATSGIPWCFYDQSIAASLKTESKCEHHDPAKLSCSANEQIKIINVFYGRDPGDNSCHNAGSVLCYNPNAKNIVNDMCKCNSTCLVYPSGSIWNFDQTCDSLNAQLRVFYICVARDSTACHSLNQSSTRTLLSSESTVVMQTPLTSIGRVLTRSIEGSTAGLTSMSLESIKSMEPSTTMVESTAEATSMSLESTKSMELSTTMVVSATEATSMSLESTKSMESSTSMVESSAEATSMSLESTKSMELSTTMVESSAEATSMSLESTKSMELSTTMVESTAELTSMSLESTKSMDLSTTMIEGTAELTSMSLWSTKLMEPSTTMVEGTAELTSMSLESTKSMEPSTTMVESTPEATSMSLESTKSMEPSTTMVESTAKATSMSSTKQIDSSTSAFSSSTERSSKSSSSALAITSTTIKLTKSTNIVTPSSFSSKFITETSVKLQQSSSSRIETSALRRSSIAIAKATSSAPVASSSIVPSPSSSLAISSSVINPTVTGKKKSKLTTVHKALIGIGCFVLLLIIILIAYCRLYRRKRYRQHSLITDEIAAVPNMYNRDDFVLEDIRHKSTNEAFELGEDSFNNDLYDSTACSSLSQSFARTLPSPDTAIMQTPFTSIGTVLARGIEESTAELSSMPLESTESFELSTIMIKSTAELTSMPFESTESLELSTIMIESTAELTSMPFESTESLELSTIMIESTAELTSMPFESTESLEPSTIMIESTAELTSMPFESTESLELSTVMIESTAELTSMPFESTESIELSTIMIESTAELTSMPFESTESLEPSTIMIKSTAELTSMPFQSTESLEPSTIMIETTSAFLSFTEETITWTTFSTQVASRSIIPFPSSSLAVSSSAIKPSIIGTSSFKLTTVHKALIGVACFVVLLVIFLVEYYRYRRRRRYSVLNNDVTTEPYMYITNAISMEDIHHKYENEAFDHEEES